MPHELWHGVTSLNRGLEIVRGADIVAVPSRVAPTTRAQFPVKIVDALMAGRPVVASAVGPIPWAVGDGGELVPPGDVDALVVALRRLADPLNRRRIGVLGRRHGRDNFTPEVVSAAFSAALDATPSLGRRHKR
jgi:glycosyltransferase involved in cell wall biosynthesis